MEDILELLTSKIEEIESKNLDDYYEGQIDGLIIAIRAIKNMEA